MIDLTKTTFIIGTKSHSLLHHLKQLSLFF